MKYNRSFYFGIGLLLIFLIMAVFAPVIAPYDPFAHGTPYLRPSVEHFLGTNDVVQDIFSELIYGARVSLTIGIVSSLVITVIGTGIGLSSACFGGRCDRILMKLTSVAMAIPSLPVAIVLAAYLDASIWNLVIAICITAWPSTARIVRAKALELMELPYIKIEKTMGVGGLRIIWKHMLPNLSDIVLTRSVLAISGAMLTEASLSFLGLGVLGQKSWGGILYYAYFRNGIINNYYWWYLPPMICISLSVLGFMLVANRRWRKVEVKGC